MDQLIGLGAIGAMVLYTLVRGYASRNLLQRRTECGNVLSLERTRRHDKEEQESQLESAEARLEQLKDKRARLETDVNGLVEETRRVEEELSKLKLNSSESDGG